MPGSPHARGLGDHGADRGLRDVTAARFSCWLAVGVLAAWLIDLAWLTLRSADLVGYTRVALAGWLVMLAVSGTACVLVACASGLSPAVGALIDRSTAVRLLPLVIASAPLVLGASLDVSGSRWWNGAVSPTELTLVCSAGGVVSLLGRRVHPSLVAVLGIVLALVGWIEFARMGGD